MIPDTMYGIPFSTLHRLGPVAIDHLAGEAEMKHEQREKRPGVPSSRYLIDLDYLVYEVVYTEDQVFLRWPTTWNFPSELLVVEALKPRIVGSSSAFAILLSDALEQVQDGLHGVRATAHHVILLATTAEKSLPQLATSVRAIRAISGR